MRLPRPCKSCGKRFQPEGKEGKVCNSCKRINFIKYMFNKNSKFKDCKDLEEAIKKYGK